MIKFNDTNNNMTTKRIQNTTDAQNTEGKSTATWGNNTTGT